MKEGLFLIIFVASSVIVQAQVNPEDEFIPVLGGRNDSPVTHAIHKPALKARDTFEKGTDSKVNQKKMKAMENEKRIAFGTLEQRLVDGRGGKLVDCGLCYGNGTKDCVYCKGAGSTECLACHGIVGRICRRCNGGGTVLDQTCSVCKGDGVGVCSVCSGKKILTCGYCGGMGHNNCTQCHGTGKEFSEGSIFVTENKTDSLPNKKP